MQSVADQTAGLKSLLVPKRSGTLFDMIRQGKSSVLEDFAVGGTKSLVGSVQGLVGGGLEALGDSYVEIRGGADPDSLPARQYQQGIDPRVSLGRTLDSERQYANRRADRLTSAESSIAGVRTVSDALAELAEENRQGVAERRPDDPVSAWLYDLTTSLTAMVPAVGAAIVTKRPNVGLSTMFAQVFGNEYQQGASATEAFLRASFEVGPEKMTGFFERIVTPATMNRLKQAVAGGSTEMITSSLNAVYDEMVDGGYDGTIKDFVKETLYAGSIGVGMGAIIGGSSPVAEPTIKPFSGMPEQRRSAPKSEWAQGMAQIEQSLQSESPAMAEGFIAAAVPEMLEPETVPESNQENSAPEAGSLAEKIRANLGADQSVAPAVSQNQEVSIDEEIKRLTASIDETVETPAATLDAGPPAELIMRNDGKPYRSRAAAEKRQSENGGLGEVVEVENGFAVSVPGAVAQKLPQVETDQQAQPEPKITDPVLRSQLPENFDDPRLMRAMFRSGLVEMQGDLTKGGGIVLLPKDDGPGMIGSNGFRIPGSGGFTRTSSVNPRWFQSMAVDTGITVEGFGRAVDRALSGKKLGVRQKEAISFALSQLNAERMGAGWDGSPAFNSWQEMIEGYRDNQRAARGELTSSEINALSNEYNAQTVERLGTRYAAEEYAAEMDAESRALYDLAEDARAQNESATIEALQSESDDIALANQLWDIANGKQPINAADIQAATPASNRQPEAQQGQDAAASEARTEAGQDRRLDDATRTSVDQMTEAEMRQALLTDELTGLGNRRAFNEAIASHTGPVISIDADSLKWINDNMSPDTGDAMLVLVGKAIKANAPRGYHTSGDEFYILASGAEDASAIMGKVESALAGAELTYETDLEIVTKQGVNITYGQADSKQEADRLLKQEKESREQSGERSGRGQEPPGVSRQSARVPTEPEAGREADGQAQPLEGDANATEQAQFDADRARQQQADQSPDMIEGDGELFAGPRPPQGDMFGQQEPNPEQETLAGPAESDGELNESAENDDTLNNQANLSEPDEAGQAGAVEAFGDESLDLRRRQDAQVSLETELSDSDIANMPLSKIWPKSDVDSIEDVATAAFMSTLRSHIPAKPRIAYKKERWVEKVKLIRELAIMYQNGDMDRIETLMQDPRYRLKPVYNQFVVAKSIPRELWPRLGAVEVNPDAYLFVEGERVASPSVYVKIDGRNTIISAKSIDDALPELLEKLGSKPSRNGRDQYTVRQIRRDKVIYIHRNADPEQTHLMEFKTSKEAFEAIDSRLKELDALWEDVKKKSNVKKKDVRRAENRARSGKDHRGGRNVTSEEFVKEFGLRHVDYGKWVGQGKSSQQRQRILNDAYDAFMDLSDVLGIPSGAIGLGGDLIMTMGKRGSGLANAHFEPGLFLINLTKTRGAGSLAHEWFHALDNYMQKKRENSVAAAFITQQPEPGMVHVKGGYKMSVAKLELNRERTESKYFASENWKVDASHPKGVRPVVEKAFADVVAALDNSPMKSRSLSTDKGKEGYWSSIIERAARSFESYTIYRMQQEGFTNDFLANVVDIKDFKLSADRYPYLLESEMQPVADAFDALFTAVEYKETESGTELYSRSKQPVAQATVESITDSLAPRAKRALIDSGLITITDSPSQWPGSHPADAAGMWKDGKIYLAASNIEAGQERGLILHEVGVHHGLAEMMGDKYQPLINSLKRQVKRGSRSDAREADKQAYRAHQRALADDTLTGKNEAAVWEETIAYMAESGANANFIQRVTAAIRDFLRKMGLVRGYSDADIAHLASGSVARIVDGIQEMDGSSMAPAMYKSGSTLANSVEETGAIPAGQQESSFGSLRDTVAEDAGPLRGDLFLAPSEGSPIQQNRIAARVRSAKVGEFRSGIERVLSPADAAHVVAPLRRGASETFGFLVTKADGTPIAFKRQNIGGIDFASVERKAWGELYTIPGAANVWMVHNHPSGNPGQSGPDAQINTKLFNMLRGTGLNYEGSVVVAPGGTFTHARPESMLPKLSPEKIPAARRTLSVPVEERALKGQRPDDSQAITSPFDTLKRVNKNYRDSTGVLFLTTKNTPIGFYPMSPESMGALRTESVDSGFADLAGFSSSINASSAIIIDTTRAHSENRSDITNVESALKTIDVRVLDGMVLEEKGGRVIQSLAEQGMDNSGRDGEFFSRRLDPDARYSRKEDDQGAQKDIDSTFEASSSPQLQSDGSGSSGVRRLDNAPQPSKPGREGFSHWVYMGKDSNGKAVMLGSNHKSLDPKGNLERFWRKNLTKEGQLTKEAFARHIESDGLKNEFDVETQHLTIQFKRAARKGYGVRFFTAIPEADQRKMNDYLAGQDVDGIPGAVRKELDVLRQMLDNLSGKLQQVLIDEVRFATESMDAASQLVVNDNIEAVLNGDEVAIETVEALSRGKYLLGKLQTLATIEGNFGSYLNRSYRIFDDPKFTPSDAVIEKARAFLEVQVRESSENSDLTDDQIASRVNGIMKSILDRGAGSALDLFGGQLGQKDRSFLKKRKDIAPEIRALLGEYKDPRTNFARSATKMAYMVAQHEFLKGVRKDGLGLFLSKRPEGSMSTEIAPWQDETMAPLAGLYATKDFAAALRDHVEPVVIEGWLKKLLLLNTAVKYGKTVLSPTTAMRNLISASMFTAMNGHFNYLHSLRAAQVVFHDMVGNQKAQLDYIKKLARLGVLHDNPNAGELRAAMDDVADMDATTGSLVGRGVKRMLNAATRFYRAGDDFWKVIGFENEKASFIKSGMTEAEAESMAADRIRNGYPTYSMVPEMIRAIRKFLAVGTFVSFPWEMIRTTGHQFRFMKEDVQAGRTAMAAKRAVGMTVAMAGANALRAVSMAMLGLSEEDDEAMRELAAPWQKNSTFAYLGLNERGQIRNLDLTHLDPYSYPLKKVVMAVLNGNNEGFDEKATSAIWEFLSPFLSTEITFGTIVELWTNSKLENDRPIYDRFAPRTEQAKQVTEHLVKNLAPGVVNNVWRTALALRGQVTSYGKEYSTQDELLAWAGFRINTVDTQTSLRFRAFDFDDHKASAGRPTYRALRDLNEVSDRQLESAANQTIATWNASFHELHSAVRAAKVSGLEEREIMSILNDAGVAKKYLQATVNEQTPEFVMTRSAVRNAMSSTTGRVSISREEFDRRLKLLKVILREEQREIDEEKE